MQSIFFFFTLRVFHSTLGKVTYALMSHTFASVSIPPPSYTPTSPPPPPKLLFKLQDLIQLALENFCHH